MAGSSRGGYVWDVRRRPNSSPAERASARNVVELVRIRTRPALLAAVEVAEVAHRVGVELEVEELEVLPDAPRRHGLREDDVAALEMPAEHHLRRSPVERLRDPLHDLVGEH